MLLYRNEMGELPRGPRGRTIDFRFVGGNTAAAPASEFGPRDGYGAMLTVQLEGGRLKREHRAGEGLSAQNSATLSVGIGALDGAQGATVRWPSGRTQESGALPAGALVTVYEDASASPTGEAFVVTEREPRSRPAALESGAAAAADTSEPLLLADFDAQDEPAALRMFTTTATWCANCRRELPQLARLRAAFEPSELAMFGVPMDATDSAERLLKYRDDFTPAYELQIGMERERVDAVQRVIEDKLKSEGLPATVVTDRNGRVLDVMWGVPTVSRLRALLPRKP